MEDDDILDFNDEERGFNEPDVFITMWSCEGLECVVPVTEMEREAVWKALKGDTSPTKNAMATLNMLMLRAKFNSQRHYEIYSITATQGITSQDIKDMFEAAPQYAADLIRERGHKLYSDRGEKEKMVIT
jgi:hypothetical protein